MGTLSTHVLDTSRGRPAAGVSVQLFRMSSSEMSAPERSSPEPSSPVPLGEGVTNADGRVPAIGPERLEPGDYRLRFDTAGYFAATGTGGFYPEVVVAFTIAEGEHYHVPLLLNPFGYSTYRGS
ncbi:MAG TPA: hydroxyisourate hydrolase [Pedococcus sp.]|nr:hydroxyisourate hydrolase [Pedococcus sp.]